MSLVSITLLVPIAFAQLQVAENTTLGLNASASVGWTGTYDDHDMSSLTYGFNGNFTGDYYDPRFLNWNVSPYLNQSKLNSNFYSTSSATGVNAIVNFLDTSRTPMQLSYSRTHDSEGTFNTPGSGGSFQSFGDGQAIGLTAAYLPEDWPSIQGSFNHAGSSYNILGLPGTGTSHSNSYALGSSYELWDTHVAGSFNQSWMNSATPLFAEPGQSLSQDTTQNSLQLSASRHLFGSTNVSSNFSRSHLNTEYGGYSTDSNFYNVGAGVNTNLTNKVGMSFNVNYSSNLSEQILSQLLTGGQGEQQGSNAGVSFTSHYLSYGTVGSYQPTRDLTIIGQANHRVQGQPGLPDFSSTLTGIGASWSHRVLGGSLGAHYGVSYSFIPGFQLAGSKTAVPDSSLTGHNAAASYGRSIFGFSTSGSVSYSRALTSVLVGYVQSNYAANASISRSINKWTVSLSGAYSHSNVEGLSLSDSKNTSYSASLSHRNWGFGGSYSHGSGSAIQVGNNLIPGGPFPIDYFVQFIGDAYAVSANYRPVRRWTITSSYSHVRYNTLNLTANSKNTSEQFFLRSEYSFRQMYFNAGYSHLSQGFGVGSVVPKSLDTVYFGISRRFDIF